MKTRHYDAAEFLTDDETMYHYLAEELERKEPLYMAKALSAVARACGGFTQLSKKTGISESDLIAASDTEHIDEATVVKVTQSAVSTFSASIAA